MDSLSASARCLKVKVGKDSVELLVNSPNTKQKRIAKAIFNKTFATSLQEGGLLQDSISNYMRKQGLWDDEKESEYQSERDIIITLEKKISKGGIKLKEARGIAIKIRIARSTIQELLINMNSLKEHSVEGQAEQEEFKTLLSLCLVYKDSGEPFFSSVEEFDLDVNSEAVQTGSAKLMEILYGSNDDYYNKLPENKFLKQYGFVDKDLNLINESGNLVDVKYRTINSDGNYIDSDGNLIDVNGNPVDSQGNYAFESSPFLDDDDNPIIEDKSEKPKRGPKKKK